MHMPQPEVIPSPAAPEGPIPGDDALARVESLYERGLFLQAYRESAPLGPLPEWTGLTAPILAGRLAHRLGAERLGRLLLLRHYRENRTDPVARFWGLGVLVSVIGPLAVYRQLQSLPSESECPPRALADLLALRAGLASAFRDFDSAHADLDAAERLLPGEPWVHVTRGSVWLVADDPQRGLVATRQALSLRPSYRAALGQTAQILCSLDRSEEARELLAQACPSLECHELWLTKVLVELELERPQEAHDSLEEVRRCAPLAEWPFLQRFCGLRSEVSYALGDRSEAIRWARMAAQPFFDGLAGRLEDAPDQGTVVRLNVEYVAQKHLTCGPACLTSLSRYFGRPVDQDAIAEAICYRGTFDVDERKWAEAQGYVTREFEVTWESACDLLDRRLPFLMTTVVPGGGHAQVVAGYDQNRSALFLRDPGQPATTEVYAQGLLEHQSCHGPRGMVLAPAQRAAALAEVTLPRTDEYDGLFRLRSALADHDRDEAARHLEAIEGITPGGRLALLARLELTSYDEDPIARLEWADALLEKYPDAPPFLIAKLSSLTELARPSERLTLLLRLNQAADCPAIFRSALARELASDPASRSLARFHARRALRAEPAESRHLTALGEILWNEGSFEDAAWVYRLAATAEDFNAMTVRDFFLARRYLGDVEGALELVTDRFQRFGGRSSEPAQNLFWCCEELGQTERAFEVLAEGLAQRPDDGALLLYGAEASGRYGRFDEAQKLLERARGKAAQTDWLQAAATLASLRGEMREALALWRQLLEHQPLSMNAHSEIARLATRIDGSREAKEHLVRACVTYPDFYPLARLHADWTHSELGAEAALPVLNRLIETHPRSAWAQRELALALASLGRLDEAAEAADEGVRLEPAETSSYGIRGMVAQQAGDPRAARAHFKRAITLDAGAAASVSWLLAGAGTPEERLEHLAFVEREVARQPAAAFGLGAYADAARGLLDDADLLERLRRLWARHRGAWAAWTALVRELARQEKHEEAASMALKATERFPLIADVWRARGIVADAGGDAAAARRCFEEALTLRPGWVAVAQELSVVLEREGDLEQSRALLERVVAHDPAHATLRGYLADALWGLGRREEALENIERAVRLDASYGWAWDRLSQWSAALGREDGTEAIARALVEERSGDAAAWFRLANIVGDKGEIDEALAALDRAESLAPRWEEVHDWRAVLLAHARRWEEAHRACQPEALGKPPPIGLLGRQAWLVAEQGDVAEAVLRMEELVCDSPEFGWGWQALARWYQSLGAHRDALRAAQALVALQPRDSDAQCSLGRALLDLDDLSGARAAFEEAFDLEPGQRYAPLMIFLIRLDQEDLAAARALIEHPTLAMDASDKAAMAAIVDLRELGLDVVEIALGRLDEIFAEPPAEVALLEHLSELLLKLDSSGRTEDALVSQALAGRSDACGFWVKHVTSKKPGWFLEPLARLEGAEQAEAVVDGYLEGLSDSGASGWPCRVMKRHGAWLASRTSWWGALGGALAKDDDTKSSRQWMSDWRNRPDAESWMLVNVALMLRARIETWAEAREVSEHALTLDRNADDTWRLHQIWLAIDELREGECGPAAQGLDEVVLSPDEGYYEDLLALAKAVREVVGSSGRPSALSQARGAFGAFKLGAGFDEQRLLSFRELARIYEMHGGGTTPRVRAFLQEGISLWVLIALGLCTWLVIRAAC